MTSQSSDHKGQINFLKQSPNHAWVVGKELWDWRHATRQITEASGVDVQELDWFLKAVSGLDGLALKLGTFRQLPEVLLKYPLAELDRRWCQRLQKQVPVQYLAGHTHWRDFTLEVSPAVLIPRPETELIIDIAINAMTNSPQSTTLSQGVWVDMGTGSGAIALGLAAALPEAQIIAVDTSTEALALAQRNAARYKLQHRITFCQGNWFEPLQDQPGSISAIVTNPPYIPTALLPTLQPEVIHHEPVAALDGGADGLGDIRFLADQAPDYLMSGGLWLTEMMAGQGTAVQAILEQRSAYRNIQIHNDLAGLDRFVLAFRR